MIVIGLALAFDVACYLIHFRIGKRLDSPRKQALPLPFLIGVVPGKLLTQLTSYNQPSRATNKPLQEPIGSFTLMSSKNVRYS